MYKGITLKWPEQNGSMGKAANSVGSNYPASSAPNHGMKSWQIPDN